MLRPLLPWIALPSLLLLSQCTPLTAPLADAGTEEGLIDEEGTLPAEDAGVDAGVDAGNPTGAPANTVFSLGITDNSAGAPQAAPYLHLLFGEGTPGPDTVVATRLETPPTLDGDGADWVDLPTSLVPLQPRGTPIGMSKAEWDAEYTLMGGAIPTFDFNVTNAVVKAAYDSQNLYFLVEWSDATENRFRDLLTFNNGIWVRSTQNEDRLYFSFNVADSFPGFAVLGCSAACHMKKRLGDVTPAGIAYRFRMHTNAPGELADIWSWRATTTNGAARADDGYWDETSRKADGPTDFVLSNRKTTDAGTFPLYMSEDGVNANPSILYAPDAGLSPRAIPYDGTALDAGVTLPGYVYQPASPGRDDVRAVGRWRNGKWTVELSRSLVTADPKDAQFPLQ